MAIDSINLYNFYFRYKWAAADFEDFQQGMVDVTRGASQGSFGAATLSGFTPVTDGTTLDLNVTQGIATSPDGTLQAILSDTVKTLVSPVTNRYKALVVVRTVITPTNDIPEPTNPANFVPLTNTYTAAIEVIYGTESSTPSYPSKLDTDTIICGLTLAPGQTALNDYDIDLEVREIVGVNSSIQQNYGKYDDRLRCFRYDTTTVAILPSQLRAPNPIAFTYVNSQTPSIFPQSTVGNYNHGTTYLNFQNGAITGADGVSVDFTPTIPSAGSFINAVVSVSYDDTISVAYGNSGTLSECYTGITSRKTTGAGSISIPNLAKPVLAVTLFSIDGTNISDMSSIDLRGFTSVPDPDQFVLTSNVDQTIDGNKTFVNNVSCGTLVPTLPAHFTTKDYVDGIIFDNTEEVIYEDDAPIGSFTGFLSSCIPASSFARTFITKKIAKLGVDYGYIYTTNVTYGEFVTTSGTIPGATNTGSFSINTGIIYSVNARKVSQTGSCIMTYTNFPAGNFAYIDQVFLSNFSISGVVTGFNLVRPNTNTISSGPISFPPPFLSINNIIVSVFEPV